MAKSDESKEKNVKSKSKAKVSKTTKVEVDEKQEISEELKNEIKEEIREEVIEEAKKVKKKSLARRIITIIIDLLVLGLLLFVIFETVIAFLGYQEVTQDKTPSYKVGNIIQEEKDGKTRYIYNFGLYKAIKTEDDKTYSYKLVPFFLD